MPDEKPIDPRLARLQRKDKPELSDRFKNLSLLEFIPALSPYFQSPVHLRDWCALFERIAAGEKGMRCLCAVPIRHHKTETTLHGVVWLLVKDPTIRILILSHSTLRAKALGKRTRVLATAAGVGPIVGGGDNEIVDWKNRKGGGVIVMSADQSKLGYDVHVLVFDDPLDENGAVEPLTRDDVDDTIARYTMRCQRRGIPGPVIGVMSRWHPEDPIGRRLLRTAETWEYIHHPAIEDEGLPTEHAFAENVWSLENMKKSREADRERDPTERLWWAQMMGDPKPVGLSKFRPDPERYDILPPWNFRLAYGVDLAYTSGDSSDYFALCVLKIFGKKAYILEVQRHKLDAHLIESTCKAALNKYGYAPFYSYVSGPEIGMVKLLRERGLPFYPLRARYNKLVRAERTIKRWNDCDIAVPRVAPWAPGFMSRVSMFVGLEKAGNDDEIDALVSAVDGSMGSVVAGSFGTMGRSYSGLNAAAR